MCLRSTDGRQSGKEKLYPRESGLWEISQRVFLEELEAHSTLPAIFAKSFGHGLFNFPEETSQILSEISGLRRISLTF